MANTKSSGEADTGSKKFLTDIFVECGVEHYDFVPRGCLAQPPDSRELGMLRIDSAEEYCRFYKRLTEKDTESATRIKQGTRVINATPENCLPYRRAFVFSYKGWRVVSPAEQPQNL